MIIDCHTHLWRSPEQLGKARFGQVSGPGSVRLAPAELPQAGPEEHQAACQRVDKAVIIGFRSAYLDCHVPNEFIAQYVKSQADRCIGFAAVDPADPVLAIEETRRARDELGLSGIAVAPAAQDFHPSSTGAMRVYAEACESSLPVCFHYAACPSREAKLEYGRPLLLDEIARELPDLKIVVAQMGFPWFHECVMLLAKQPNVYADISGLLRQPWTAYNVLLAAYEQGVIDKLLFGSGFPYATATACLEALYSVNQIVHGTSLPVIPRERLRAIAEHNALGVLGIEAPAEPDDDRDGSVLDDDL